MDQHVTSSDETATQDKIEYLKAKFSHWPWVIDDIWLESQGLNKYGDAKDTVYTMDENIRLFYLYSVLERQWTDSCI